MMTVETIGRIRRAHLVEGESIRDCAAPACVAQVVRRAIASETGEFHYERKEQPLPKLGPHVAELNKLLEANMAKRKRERLTTKRLTEQLKGLVTRAATTRCVAMRNAGSQERDAAARPSVCAADLSRPARPTSSIGATRSSSWTG